MKTTRKSLSQNFKAVVLFRDDLEKIEEIAKTELSAKSFSIAFDEHVYESIAEIAADTQDTHNLKLVIHNPYISIDLNEYGSSMYGSNENLEAKGAFDSIATIIAKHQHKIIHFFYTSAPVVGGPFFGLFLVVGIIAVARQRWSVALGSFIIVLMVSVWWYLFYQYSFHRSSTVVFSTLTSRPNFIKRKKDDLIINLVIAALFFLIGLLIHRT